MKAAVMHAAGEPLAIENVDIALPALREVLIRTIAVGVCHSDLHILKGAYPWKTPTVLGHEAAGIVEAVGAEVRHVAPGDHVITCLSAFCGHCEYCNVGRPSLCDSPDLQRGPDDPPRLSLGGRPVAQFVNLSAFAEMMLVHEQALVKVRPDMPLDRAALIGCGVTTGVGAVHNTARVEPGSTVAVIGLGGVGLSCINGAFIAGAARVIAIDRVATKLDLARRFGATDTIDASTTDAVKAVRDLTGGGVHYSFEAIGLKQTAEDAFRMLRPGGTATVIGMIPVGTRIELHGADFLREKRIQGSMMGSNRFRVDMPRYVELYMQGRLKLDELISQRIRLENVNAALAALENGGVARSVIMFDA